MSQQNGHVSVRKMFLATLGVVFGDIGTSPLYTVKECLNHPGIAMQETHILGLNSLIYWSLMIVVSYKYIVLILRADNHGEGGILALTALTLRDTTGTKAKMILMLGLIGASMFYGDSIITPAISVLGALEGLKVADPTMHLAILPLAVGILIALFLAQKSGTHSLGKYFGITALLWFVAIGAVGLNQIIQAPRILYALNPVYALYFLYDFKIKAFVILSSVVLALTGAEALYADMGHFNKRSIRVAWFALVLPSLMLNYFGQGALLIEHPDAISNPFYLMVPKWGLYPMILIATLATIIAGQAVISGMFSMTWQAVQLGFLPRMRVIHTSAQHFGQVYVPSINIIMLFLTVLSVLIFQGTDALASAYGITVTIIMMITTLLTSILSHKQWEWSMTKVIFVFGSLIIVDLAFLSSNTLKFMDGGWFPVVISAAMFIVMTTWKTGRESLTRQAKSDSQSLSDFLKMLKKSPPHRISGTAVFLTGAPHTVPNSLKVHLKHNKVLHEQVIFLSVLTQDIPRVSSKDRLQVEKLAPHVFQIVAEYGFMEIPNIPQIFSKARDLGIKVDIDEVSYYLSRGIPMTAVRPYMANWREKLFVVLAHNAMNATEFFQIPMGRVIELGVRYRI
jgi:KUP system potassium uptake protein